MTAIALLAIAGLVIAGLARSIHRSNRALDECRRVRKDTPYLRKDTPNGN